MYITIKPPTYLRESAQPPKQLYLIGGLEKQRMVAIVGTRRPTAEGQETATEIAYRLASNQVTVISGLARGIDSAAHRGALKAQGLTVAVLPCGIETIYPAGGFSLAKKIVDGGGGLVSEYEGDKRPQKHDFLARNRIIAGLSQLVIVVEAGIRSGSLNTARHAMEMGIDVMAVPGSIYSPNSAGTNRLIAQGAIPITSIKDVLDYLSIKEEDAQPQIKATTKKQAEILKHLLVRPLAFEDLCSLVGGEQRDLNNVVTELEISGAVERLPGNLIKIRG